MGKSQLKGKDLRKVDYPSNKFKSLAINILNQHHKYLPKPEKLQILENVLSNPDDYLEDEVLRPLAELLVEVVEKQEFTSYKLKSEPKPYRVYGRKFICQNTIHQMDLAMQLPVAVEGALMPDAHVGYGLPIGGVLATENAIIPYGVGLDIGCRMSLSIYETPGSFVQQNRYQIKKALKEETHFGIRKRQEALEPHEVLDRSEFQANEVLRQLHDKAAYQLGTSGSGNHFVEAGIVELPAANPFNLPEGNYFGVLAHSGSRGLGAAVANLYTRIAMDTCRLPQGARHLAWLDLNSEAGQEYWLAMNLAGDYAKACHDVIHQKMARALGLRPWAKVENHHNFAWKEKQSDGREWIVHRKGATPAQRGSLGIIPATMSEAGRIVRGLGQGDALHSASHGAGRKLSRRKAKASITGSEMKKVLKQAGITLIGGGVDEAPMAYKNIDEVMNQQTDLVETVGKFHPRIVRMDKA